MMKRYLAGKRKQTSPVAGKAVGGLCPGLDELVVELSQDRGKLWFVDE